MVRPHVGPAHAWGLPMPGLGRFHRTQISLTSQYYLFMSLCVLGEWARGGERKWWRGGLGTRVFSFPSERMRKEEH